MLILIEEIFDDEKVILNLNKNNPVVFSTDEDGYFIHIEDKILGDTGLFNENIPIPKEKLIKLINIFEKAGFNFFKKITDENILVFSVHEEIFFQFTENKDEYQEEDELFIGENTFYIQQGFVTSKEIYSYFKIKNNLKNLD